METPKIGRIHKLVIKPIHPDTIAFLTALLELHEGSIIQDIEPYIDPITGQTRERAIETWLLVPPWTKCRVIEPGRSEVLFPDGFCMEVRSTGTLVDVAFSRDDIPITYQHLIRTYIPGKERIVSAMNQKLHPSTYFVQDQSNQDEMTRLHVQDTMVTTLMGGVLSEQPDPGLFRSVLDVGCGPGDWLLQVAQTYPHITELVGVDTSVMMIREARLQAQTQGLQDRVIFKVMDALRMLEFRPHTFSLVNQRFGASYLRSWDWDQLIHHYQSIACHGGTIRITECNVPTSNSPALNKFNDLLLQAASQAGYQFIARDGDSIINELPKLLTRHGMQGVQTRYHHADFRAGTPEGQGFIEDETYLFRTAFPFLNKWTRLPGDYEQLLQQAQTEMDHPDFHASWTFCTVWGENP